MVKIERFINGICLISLMSNSKSIIVSMWNASPETVEVVDNLFIPGILNNLDAQTQLIMIDDQSPLKNETKSLVEAHSDEIKKRAGNFVFVRNDKNLGFAGSYNKGMQISEGDDVLITNDDVYLTKGSVRSLFDVLRSDEKIGAVGPVTNYAYNFQRTGLFDKIKDYSPEELQRIESFASWLRNVMNEKNYSVPSGLTAFCTAFPREVIESTGGFYEGFKYGLFEDTDLMARIAESGHDIILDASTFVEHGGPKGGSISLMQDFGKAASAWATNFYKCGKRNGFGKIAKGALRMNLQYPLDILTVTSEIKKMAEEKGLMEDYQIILKR